VFLFWKVEATSSALKRFTNNTLRLLTTYPYLVSQFLAFSIESNSPYLSHNSEKRTGSHSTETTETNSS
jgi:chlorite dismutase